MQRSYRTLLGDEWDTLPPGVRLSFSPPVHAEGTLSIFVASRGIAGLLARFIQLPAAGGSVPATLEILEKPEGIEWTRTFGGMRAVSLQHIHDSSVREAIPPFDLELAMGARDGAILVSQTRLRIFGIPIPKAFCPQVAAKVTAGEDDESWRVHVTIGHVWFGTMCRYEGLMCTSQSGS